MGKRLRTWYKKTWQWAFGVGNWRGASEDWSPVQSTTRAGQSSDFDEAEIMLAFDKLIGSLYVKPDYLREFELVSQQNHYYRMADVPTGNYGPQEFKELQILLALA